MLSLNLLPFREKSFRRRVVIDVVAGNETQIFSSEKSMRLHNSTDSGSTESDSFAKSKCSVSAGNPLKMESKHVQARSAA